MSFGFLAPLGSEAFRLLGNRMVLVHLKDDRMENGRLVRCNPGVGELEVAEQP